MGTESTLSELQLAIMRVLWDRGEATVAEVHDALHDQRGLAPTTISTVLTRLEKRGLVRHRREGRQFVYAALVSDQVVRQSAVAELTDRVFQGDVTKLVSHLLKVDDLSPGDLEHVKRLIADKERELSQKNRRATKGD